ncbi:tetratricopeptide repeat protein [Nocardia higoensis]|uniref:Tetratricopeptide repeat protein n=1 Tax=Nocardia higoensis TaxID=228599 RepID=A0ABS0DNJ0_9NOCA|nr:FxSxx-COOH system tetratricopeptide repeat protein [Nocardia higoensis]MBF6358258.1 tetratricopeptide repeat protein [Nocardia higoensis]
MTEMTDARAEFFAELDRLRVAARAVTDRRPPSVQVIARNTGVPVGTVRSWFPISPSKPRTVPRKDEQLVAVLEFFLRRAGRLAQQQPLDRRTREDWLARRDAAAAVESLEGPDTGSDDDATVGHRAGATGSPPVRARKSESSAPRAELVVVGKIPDEPEHFVVRDQLDELERGLAGERVAVVVTGMRGAGKTQVAAAYARRVLASGQGLVGWVEAESADLLHSGLAAIADRLGVADPDGDAEVSAARLRDHLHTHSQRALLVFDNATEIHLVRSLLPTAGATRVVITSTHRGFARLSRVVIDTGTGYTRPQSLTYLAEATGIDDDPDNADELAEELGDLPLALAAAAGTIAASPAMNYERYLTRLRSRTLPQALRKQDGQDHPLSVDQALLFAIEAAEEPTGDTELDTVIAWLLGLFAVLAPSGVDRALLVHPDLDDLVDDAIDHCVQRCLLSWAIDETSTANTTLSVHRLTARVLRERARDADTTETIVASALVVLAARLFDRSDAWSRRSEGVHLIEQIDALTHNPLASLVSEEIQQLLLAISRWAVRQLIETADLTRAIESAHRSITDHERVLGTDHPDTLLIRSNLANAYRDAGRVEQAIGEFERLLNDCERIHGPDHPNTLLTRSNLAHAYRAAGRVEQAIKESEHVLTDQQRVLGPDHLSTLLTRGNLAHAYRAAGRVEQAIKESERLLTDQQRVLGPDHPSTLITHGSLAHAYQAAGRVEQAIPLLEQTATDCERVLGPDHPDTLSAHGNLANTYRDAGRVEQAIPLLEQTATDCERVLGPDHPDTLSAHGNLAHGYRVAGRVEQAIEKSERLLTDCERILGPNHLSTLITRNNLASAYQAAGRVEQAIEAFERLLTDCERILGPNHLNTSVVRGNLKAVQKKGSRS